MAWNDRLREAAYTSPTGNRFTFDYENVSETVDKKTTAYNFPDADGTYVQDLGHSGRRYPLRVFFWGDDYDLEAETFINALLEKGIGRLEHPIYGTVDVVPFGTITRNDELKTAANQAVLEISFWETIGLIYPTSQDDPGSSVVTAVDEFNNSIAAEFEETTTLDNAVDAAIFKNRYTALLDSASSGLEAIANTQDDVRQQFNAINDSINNGIDVLVGDPLTLAFQTTQLIQAPAKALTSIQARLDAYKNLSDSIISGDGAASPASSNDFHTDDLYASTYVSALVTSVVNNQFDTKTDALEAADFLLTQFNSVIDWRDLNFQSLDEVDTGGAYQQLQEAVALTAGFLVQISFNLRQEKSLVLDRNHTIVDLVAQLYGNIDESLDFFINSNNLSGSEILELPKGREIVYYV